MYGLGRGDCALNSVIVVAVAFAAVVLLLRYARSAPHRYPYQQREHLFTPAELHFLQTLRQAAPGGVDIFGKVRVADVLKPEAKLDRSTWQKAFNRTAGKHFDFVLCDRETGRMLCAIELNDRSHQRRDRQERDDFIAGACRHAGFPLLFVPAARRYDVAAVRSEIQLCLTAGAPPGSALATPMTAQAPAAPAASPFSGHGLACPRCGSQLLKKTAQRGKYAGETFLSCANFPHCRYSRSS